MPQVVLDIQISCHRQVAVRTVYPGIVPLQYSVQSEYSPPYPQQNRTAFSPWDGPNYI